MRTVDILIATYNGKEYLPQQLLSIMGQSFKDWKIIIHDDGSTDGTIEIIQKFCQLDSRITFINDGITFKSPAKNFLHLLNFTRAPYICFCDQDDIWIENKLSVMLANSIKTFTPTVIVSTGYIFQTNTNKIIGSLNYTITSLNEFLFVNGGIHGSRCMINEAMKESMLKYYGPINMHDHLMTQIACSFGDIKYIDMPLFFYRQHNHNVTGNIVNSRINRLIIGFSSIKKKFLISQEIYQCNLAFYNQFKDDFSPQNKSIFQKYLSIKYKNYFTRLLLIIKGKYSLCSNARLHLLIKAASRKLFNS